MCLDVIRRLRCCVGAVVLVGIVATPPPLCCKKGYCLTDNEIFQLIQ